MSLLIAMPGPHSARSAADAPSGSEALPALPVLTSLLVRARRLPDARDWRGGVLAALGGGSVSVADAAVAAWAMDCLPVGAGLCFAAPLHVVAGMSRVHLPPGGWLQLDANEEVLWLDAFNREFGGADLRLHAAAGGWLLAADFAGAAADDAPEQLVGEPLARAPARSDDERALRRLGAEVELWLAGHALNRQREARNQPPLNVLWFWGGARAAPRPPLAHAPRRVLVAGEADPWLAGLAAHCGLVPARVGECPALADGTLLVLAPPRSGLSADHWQGLESGWLAPAARALRARQITTLRLQIGNSAWLLPDSSLLRWLRRRRPWYRQVAA
jgi:hypothetical protein